MEISESKKTADTANDENSCDAEKPKAIVKNEPNQKEEVPPEPKIPFTCKICHFTMDCEYRGKAPRFAKNIQFNEDCYLMQDPFSPPPGNLSSKSLCEHFIVIGSDCCYCGSAFCQLNSCGIFYRKFYCSDCAFQLVNTFPVEIQSKIRKFCRRSS